MKCVGRASWRVQKRDANLSVNSPRDADSAPPTGPISAKSGTQEYLHSVQLQ